MTFPSMTPWRTAAVSLAFVVCWQTTYQIAVANEWGMARAIDGWGWFAVFVLGFCWLIWGAERLSQQYESRRGHTQDSAPAPEPSPMVVWTPVICWLAAIWIGNSNHWITPETVPEWAWAGIFALAFSSLIWAVEHLAVEYEVRCNRLLNDGERVQLVWNPRSRQAWFYELVWNPCDIQAWYYGRRARRLRQTLVFMTSYSFGFVLVYLLVHLSPAFAGDLRPFELPAGGGSDQAGPAPRTVRVQKQVRRKYVINPFSSILFAVPSIDKIELKVGEDTRHEYKAGYGSGTGTGTGGIGSGGGKGSGFGSGTGSGKVRLPRLKHAGRGWDKNFGIGGDNNMLLEYSKYTQGQKVEEKSEPIEVSQLARYTPTQAPPFVLVTGTDGFSLSATDRKIVKQYLLEKCGMFVGDNLGGGSFHNQFIQTMREITGVQEVPIPRDDYIHARPELLPSLPIVVAHGGTVALGWKVDGRWVAYYHPGALTDAWRDDHAGIKREIWVDCYRLGTNIIFYAYVEKHKWNEARRQR